MKKLLIILLAISLFSCKTKTVVTKTDTEVKKDIVEKKDSVKVAKNNSTTISLDNTFAEIERVEYYYSKPDTLNKQFVEKKITTKINKEGKKTTFDVSNMADSLDVKQFKEDKTKTETSFYEKVVEKVRTPYGVTISILVLLLFLFLIIKKYIL